MRFAGEIGYADGTAETPPGSGVWEDALVEYSYFGDVFRNVKKQEESPERVLDNIIVQNSISVVADAYALEHFMAIRYIRWLGTLWKVDTVEVQRPRLILRLGGVYNGPTPAAP